MSGEPAPGKPTQIVLLGDQSVGKTSVMNRFTYDSFNDAYQATTVVDYLSKTMYLDYRTVLLQLWDTPGQARFHSLIPPYIRGSSVALVVYDITNRTTFISTNKWVLQARSEKGPDAVIMLIGNKADLSHNRQVTTEEAIQQAKELDIMFMETSAKSGHNIKALFDRITMSPPGMEILSVERGQLRSALDQYVRAFSGVRDACISGGRFNSSPEIIASLEQESNVITSHIRRLEDARAVIHAARSSIPKVVPIATLPPEIIARIFQFLVPGQRCLVERCSEGKISKVKFPLYPDNLAHVCSSWRRVAISTPSLWTHIDIVLDHSLNPGVFARAKVYVMRAGQLPLEIHISDPGSERERKRGWATQEDPTRDPNYQWEDLHEFKFLPSNTVPIKTLELDLHIHARYREVYYSVLEYFFARSKLGILDRYVVRGSSNGWTRPNPFIEPVDTPHSLDGALLAVSSAHLEELWLHTSILRVSGLCPNWKSKAYFGLVELYIDQGIPELSELQMVDILRSSPKLQVFHIKAVIGELIRGANIQPIYLEDLRDLNVMIQYDEEICVPHVLRWIAPGQNPLQFAYLGAPGEGLTGLFSRGNVTRFYIARWNPFPLLHMLNKSPRLETLVLDGLDDEIKRLNSLLDMDDLDDGGGDLDDDDDSDDEAEIALERVSPSATQIHTLYLLRFKRFRFEEIQAVAKQYSVQRLVIYGGNLSYQTDDGRVVSDNLRNTKIKLSSITACPDIEYHPDSKLITRDCDTWIVNSLIPQ